MFDYLWWLLPSFMKKSQRENSNVKGILGTVADSLFALKDSILKSRLTKFFVTTDTKTDFYDTEYTDYLKMHAFDRNLPHVSQEELLIDPQMRTFQGTKQGIKYYSELLIPEIRVDFIYEISADDKKWVLFSKSDQEREAMFNRSVLLSKFDRDDPAFTTYRFTRIYSRDDNSLPEFLFWVKAYNRINEDGTLTVYPEKILTTIDRFKPAHTRGYLVFNYIDVEITNITEGQVFISETVNFEGKVVQLAHA